MTNNIQKYNITISPKNNSSQQDIINEIVTNYANSFNLLSIQITATIIRIFVSNSVQYYDVTVKITTPSDITPPNTDQFISASNNTPTTYTPYPKSVVNISGNIFTNIMDYLLCYSYLVMFKTAILFCILSLLNFDLATILFSKTIDTTLHILVLLSGYLSLCLWFNTKPILLYPNITTISSASELATEL